MKRGLMVVEANFSGGINQDLQTANFRTQCSDARNVWTPTGSVETRPGSDPYFHTGLLLCMWYGNTAGTAPAYAKITPGGIQTFDTAGSLNLELDIDGLIVIQNAYSSITRNELTVGIKFELSADNANETRLKAGDYPAVSPYINSVSNGGIRCDRGHLSSTFASSPAATYGSSHYIEPWTILGATYFSFTVKEFAISAACNSDAYPRWFRPGAIDGGDGTDDNTRATFRSAWSGYIGNQYITGAYWFGVSTGVLHQAWCVGLNDFGQAVMGTSPSIASGFSAPTYQQIDEPITTASVAYNGLLYLALKDGVHQLGSTNIIDQLNVPASESATPAMSPALVETNPLIVGVGYGAPYAKDQVAQLDAFPKAKYIAFFQNRFWFAGIEGEPQIVRWGAAAPSHLVLPSLNFEDVIENNAQDISGMAPLGADMMIYKPDSIHRMVFTGLNSFQEATYVPQTVANGVGCVSNASIADVNGTHVFLSNRGLVQFDGTTATWIAQHKENGMFCDRLQDIWPRITPGKYKWSVGVHWKAKHCYLLACSIDGSEQNNLVIVWDYVQKAFWLWDSLDVAGWFFEDKEQKNLCYSDSYGRFIKLAGATDRATDSTGSRPILAYVTTTELMDQKYDEIVIRQAEVTGRSAQSPVSVAFYHDGNAGDTGTITIKDNLELGPDSFICDSSLLAADKTRTRHLATWQGGRYHQVKLSQSTLGCQLYVDTLRLGYRPTNKNSNG